MKQLLLKTLLACVFTASGVCGVEASPRMSRDRMKPLGRMRSATPASDWMTLKVPEGMKRLTPDHSTPASDSFQYMVGPDGSDWFATCDLDVETIQLEGGYVTENVIKGYTFTIYNSNFKEIGSIHDVITLEEGETRCAQAMLAIDVTKKFFNYDDKYEVMVSLCMNAQDYSMNIRTNVYSIGGAKADGNDIPVQVIDGYPVDALNTAEKPWDENFYITFLTEISADPDGDYPSYIDYLADFKQVLTTYTKAGLGGGISSVATHSIPMLNLPGDQMVCPMMLSNIVDGKLTLTYQQYEKSFFVDPSGMGGDESITPDNNLVIDVYQLPDTYTKEMTHLSTTKIPTPPSEAENALYTFYGVGNLRYNNDVDFGNYSADGRPCFVVSVDEYQTDDDDNYNSSYYVYDADGNRLKTLAEDTFSFVIMSDIAGCEPQVMFINTGDEWTFQFVDLYSARTVAEVDQMYRGFGLSTSIDRVAAKDGYAYAVATSNGIADEEAGELYAPVCWLDRDGEFIRLDKINVGKGVEMVRFYINSDALSPFVFNTDTETEYMLLVKRQEEDGSGSLREELLIATADKGALHTFLPTEEKGVLGSVFLLSGSKPQLVITYVKDDRWTSDAYVLPFTKFAGGSGTESDPYLVATAGDLMQISNAPGAHYSITADIDCAGATMPQTPTFTGTLNGNGHTISNIALYGSGNAALFKECNGATIKDVDFYDCSLGISGNGESSLLAGTAIGSTFDNIHIRRLSVTGNSFSGQFAPISCRTWSRTAITACEVADADINLPLGSGVGGIAGDMRTGSSVVSSAFSGRIIADNTVGGIVASTTTGDEEITSCHVDADLKAGNTVGGIAGFLDRSKVTGCYVEGTIEATTPSKWTKALAAGGIAGELEGDWEGTASVPVSGNLIGLTAIIVPELDLTEDYPHQLATVHRVVGRTSYNAQPKEDENGVPSTEVIYETGVLNNLVLADLAVVDPDFAEKSIEGTSIDKYEVTSEMLESQLGFKYGNDASAPWNIQTWYAFDPSLYYESAIHIPHSEINVTEGETFSIDIAILSRTAVSEDELLGDFMCEYDMELMEMTGGMTFDGKTMTIEFNALKEGTSTFSTSIMGSTAACKVNIAKDENVGVTEVEGTEVSLEYADGILMAAGCRIYVYDMNGRLLASGFDSIDTATLPHGVYAASARLADGHQTTLKFAR